VSPEGEYQPTPAQFDRAKLSNVENKH